MESPVLDRARLWRFGAAENILTAVIVRVSSGSGQRVLGHDHTHEHALVYIKFKQPWKHR